MHLSKPTSTLLDANTWLKASSLPYWTLAALRDMRVGDEYALADFMGPGLCGSRGGLAQVVVTRVRGGWYVNSLWTLHLGKNAWRRGHIYAQARFRIAPERQFELLPDKPGARVEDSLAGMRAAALILRRSAALARWAKAQNSMRAYLNLHPQFFRSRRGPGEEAVNWLEAMRGPDRPQAAPVGDPKTQIVCA